MATALDLIEAAYVQSTANDAGKLATDGELLLALNRIFQSRYAIWAIANRESALARATLTLAGSPASATLPTDLIDFDRLELNSTAGEVRVIPVSEKDRTWHLAPCVFRQGSSLVTRGKAGDPVAANAMTLWHLDAPATLSAVGTVLDTRFPVRFHDLLILDLALYLDSKDEKRDQAAHAKLRARWEMHDEAFGFLNRRAGSTTETPHRDRDVASVARKQG